MPYKDKPFAARLAYIPFFEKRRALVEAERRAAQAVASYPDNAATTELYWLVFNFEYRKQIERLVEDHANL